MMITQKKLGDLLDEILKGNWRARDELIYYFTLEKRSAMPRNGLGQGKKEQKKECFKKISKAAKKEKPNRYAIAFLGLLYENGVGCEKSYTVAKSFYDSAAALGNPWGQDKQGDYNSFEAVRLEKLVQDYEMQEKERAAKESKEITEGKEKTTEENKQTAEEKVAKAKQAEDRKKRALEHKNLAKALYKLAAVQCYAPGKYYAPAHYNLSKIYGAEGREKEKQERLKLALEQNEARALNEVFVVDESGNPVVGKGNPFYIYIPQNMGISCVCEKIQEPNLGKNKVSHNGFIYKVTTYYTGPNNGEKIKISEDNIPDISLEDYEDALVSAPHEEEIAKLNGCRRVIFFLCNGIKAHKDKQSVKKIAEKRSIVSFEKALAEIIEKADSQITSDPTLVDVVRPIQLLTGQIRDVKKDINDKAPAAPLNEGMVTLPGTVSLPGTDNSGSKVILLPTFLYDFQKRAQAQKVIEAGTELGTELGTVSLSEMPSATLLTGLSKTLNIV